MLFDKDLWFSVNALYAFYFMQRSVHLYSEELSTDTQQKVFLLKDLCTFNICTFQARCLKFNQLSIKHLYYKNKNACTLKAFIMTTAFKTINTASKKKRDIEMNELGKDANS